MSGYTFDSETECVRLDRQADLMGTERLLSHFHVSAGARVLDAGCGSGVVARLLASRHPDADVVGVDLNPNYLTYARQRAAAEGLSNVSFQEGDLQNLPFSDGTFDVVWSEFVLQFVPDVELAVSEMRRVLRPGSAVVLAMHENWLLANYPEDRSLQERLERLGPGVADIRTVRRLPLLLRRAGFQNVSVEIELDRLYTAIGTIEPELRRNLVELLTPAMPRIGQILGGPEQAERFLSDLLAYLDSPDTCTYTQLWMIKGTAPV